jgi:hypothetical protein
MKTRYLKTDWFIPLMGIAAAVGALVAARAYFNIEQKIHTGEASLATLDHLHQDQAIVAALKQVHEGKADEAAQRLDLLVCQDVLLTNSELESADAGMRTVVEDAFRKIALRRPQNAQGAPGSPAQERNQDQVSAEKILKLVLAGDPRAQAQ